MRSIDITKPDRKSGGSRGTCSFTRTARKCRQAINERPKSSGDSEHITLFDRRGLLSSLEAIDDGEYFVSASGRIAAHGVIVHRHYD